MNPEIFAEWMDRQGMRVVQTKTCFWVESVPRVYQAIPYHNVISPSEEETTDFLRKEKAISLRYSTPYSMPEGQISYHVVFEGNEFLYDNFSKKVRHDIKHGIDYCEYKPISLLLMEEQGWQLREETLNRQGRKGAETKEWWCKLCRSAEGLQGFEAWGALRNGTLVASIFTYNDDGIASVLYQQSLTEHLKHGINNTLAYIYVNDILNNKKASGVFYGLHSLDAPASVDDFKFRMGFKAKAVRQRVIFNPTIAPFFNNITHAGIKAAHRIFPGVSTFAKAEGMIRFSLQGRYPIDKQDWPEVLLEQKDAILAQTDQT